MWWYPEDGFLELYLPQIVFNNLYQLLTFPVHIMIIILRPLDDVGVVSASFLLTYLFSLWLVEGTLEVTHVEHARVVSCPPSRPARARLRLILF